MTEQMQVRLSPTLKRVLETPCPLGHAGVNGACHAFVLEGRLPMRVLFVCLERIRAADSAPEGP